MLPWSLKLRTLTALLGMNMVVSTFAQSAPGQVATLIPGPAAPAPAKPKLSPLAQAPDWKQIASLSGQLTRDEFEQAISSIYTDGSTFPVPWHIEADALVVETSPGKEPVHIQFRSPAADGKTIPRFWRTPAILSPLKPGEPILKGLHIALDPGHIGGGYAQMEERWLSMNPGEVIMEGSLVLQIAQLLKPRLEALGARVSLVRASEAPVTTMKVDDFKEAARTLLHEAGVAKPPETYTGRHDETRVVSVQWQAEKLFYRVSEIRARAQRVNQELRPDLVLCLHLNAEEWGDPQHPAFVDHNHFHLLINGCYSADELQLEDVRYEMLRRLFCRVHEQEHAMADVAASAMMEATGLSPFVYITRNARRVSANPAVFARNLLANRIYECPVLYFEPYVMNHEQTYKRFLLGHYIGRTLLENQLVSSPLEDYTRGVVRGLVDYYKRARSTK